MFLTLFLVQKCFGGIRSAKVVFILGYKKLFFEFKMFFRYTECFFEIDKFSVDQNPKTSHRLRKINMFFKKIPKEEI